MKAVVLAAGKGTRLNPLTATRPKPMLPIVGRPVLERVLYSIREAGISDVGIVVHHFKEVIKRYVGDGSRFGIRVEYIEQERVEGTAAAVEVAEQFVGSDDFLVVYGDVTLTPEAITGLIEMYRRSGADAVILGAEVSNPEDYGVLSVSNGRLVGLIEKPRKEEVKSNMINAGAIAFSNKAMEYVKQVGYSPRGERELTDAIKALARDGTVLVYNAGPGWWFDIGKPWDLIDANKYYVSRISMKIMGEVNPGATVIGPVVIEEGSEVLPGALVVGPAYIGPGSRIEYNAVIGPHTCVGSGVVVGPLSYIAGSVIMDNTVISSHCAVFESVLGENVYLESGVKIPGYNIYGTTVKVLVKGRKVDSGRVKLGAIVGDNVKIGANASIFPGVTVMPDALIPPGASVTEDVL